MKLYEINAAITDLLDKLNIDSETGEVTDDAILEQLDKLSMERESVLQYLAKAVLNARSDIASIKAEEQRLRERRQAVERLEERLMSVLDRECRGKKTSLGVATVSYRKTTKLDVIDSGIAIEWLQEKGFSDCYRTSIEINKTETKKLIAKGIDVPGCVITQSNSCSLR